MCIKSVPRRNSIPTSGMSFTIKKKRPTKAQSLDASQNVTIRRIPMILSLSPPRQRKNSRKKRMTLKQNLKNWRQHGSKESGRTADCFYI